MHPDRDQEIQIADDYRRPWMLLDERNRVTLQPWQRERYAEWHANPLFNRVAVCPPTAAFVEGNNWRTADWQPRRVVARNEVVPPAQLEEIEAPRSPSPKPGPSGEKPKAATECAAAGGQATRISLENKPAIEKVPGFDAFIRQCHAGGRQQMCVTLPTGGHISLAYEPDENEEAAGGEGVTYKPEDAKPLSSDEGDADEN